MVFNILVETHKTGKCWREAAKQRHLLSRKITSIDGKKKHSSYKEVKFSEAVGLKELDTFLQGGKKETYH